MAITLRPLFATILFLLLAGTAKSQRYLGIATSKWNSINGLYLNPANIADCKELVSINIFSLNVAVDNNLGHLPKIVDIGAAINDNNNVFTKSNGKTFDMMAPAATFRGPGIVARLSKNAGIALTTGIRGMNQFNNFDPSIYKAISAAGGVPLDSYNVNTQKFNWTAHLWSEVGITFATLIDDGPKHRLNIGITLRRNAGIGFASVLGKNMDLYFKKGSDSFRAANSDIIFASNVLNDSSEAFNDLTPSGLFGKFFGGTVGVGYGGDLGITYAYRFSETHVYADDQAELYDIVFGAAVTDFGAISYYNSTNVAVNIGGNGNLSLDALDTSMKDVASVVKYAATQGFSVDTVTRPRKVYLPTALVLTADAWVYGRFYANVLYVANLMGRMKFGNSYYNQITLTPRYDFHKLTVAVPLTYSCLARDFKMGVGVRYKGFYVGSDDVLASISKCQYGFNFYFGGYVPLFKRSKIWMPYR